MEGTVDYEKMLEEIRKCYKENQHLMTLPPKPEWLREENPLIKIYRNFPELKSRGHITYGCIVQANYLLFEDGDKDLPADIIIADSPIGEEFPEKLIDVARELNDYTEVSNFRVPRNVREVVKQLKDQYDMRTRYIDYSKKGEHPFNIYNIPIMVFREHLYERKIMHKIYPVIFLPENPGVAMFVPSEIYSPRQEEKSVRENPDNVGAGSGLRLKV